MNENIYFFNNFHNGDIFYSKEFVRDIKNKIGLAHYYIHNNDFSILKDMNINQIRSIMPYYGSKMSKIDGNLYINTWVGQQEFKYLEYGCSLKSNYNIFCDIYKELGIKIEPIDFYIPKINFEKINTIKINNYFEQNRKYILVCNNYCESNQSLNFDFDTIINNLSENYKDIIFIMTNDTKLSKENIITVSDIIGYNQNNLLEISYISTKINTIIGRASGPYCFTHFKDNMENKNKIFISFSYRENASKWIFDEICQAKQYWFNIFDDDIVIKNIKDIINE